MTRSHPAAVGDVTSFPELLVRASVGGMTELVRHSAEQRHDAVRARARTAEQSPTPAAAHALGPRRLRSGPVQTRPGRSFRDDPPVRRTTAPPGFTAGIVALCKARVLSNVAEPTGRA